jgi:hypothetical protein
MGGFGLITGPRGDRQTANLIPSGYGAMLVDTNADGVVDGFTKADSSAVSIYELDGGQKITLADVTSTAAYSRVSLTGSFGVSPNTAYTLSLDAALTKSGVEAIRLVIAWYTAADGSISSSTIANLNPGTSYSRLSLTATSPATAAKAIIRGDLMAGAVGATGVAHFKDALFQPT